MSPNPSEDCYAFTTFQLFPKRRTLLRDGELVEIGGRSFDLLLLLVSRAGVIVSAGELMRCVWPNITVVEANLRVQMSILRKILSECADARRAVETVPLRGYCFTLPVQHHSGASEPEGLTPPRAHASPPIPLSPIIGRDDAIGAIVGALEERRLVSITGPGGIGKTAVAIAASHQFATQFSGTIVFVELSDVTDGSGAALAITEKLGVEPRGDAIAALCAHLRSCDTLLILDTCEHIVEPIAVLVETLLSCCARLRLLITSRERLRVTGEWTHRLPALTFPSEEQEVTEANMDEFSAISLFMNRVRLTTRFETQSRELATVARICRRLDGIPLALEFAAARVADLGLAELASHLDDRFCILTRGRRTALPRHRTLSATVDWSYNLLSNDEQLMLRRLTLVGDLFTADQAIASAHDAGCSSPPEALAGLHEKSLISSEIWCDKQLYRLFDTTKAYIESIRVAS